MAHQAGSAVTAALGAGYRHIDTAAAYGNERQVGEAVPASAGGRAAAAAHGRSPAQVMLRWHLQAGRPAISKSTRPQRIAENLHVFDFELTAQEVTAIDGLDTGQRGGPEPDAVTLARFGREIPEA